MKTVYQYDHQETDTTVRVTHQGVGEYLLEAWRKSDTEAPPKFEPRDLCYMTHSICAGRFFATNVHTGVTTELIPLQEE